MAQLTYILGLDENIDNMSSMVEPLKQFGFVLQLATSLTEARDRKLNTRPAALLLSTRIAEGAENLIKQLKQHKEFSRVPIIAVASPEHAQTDFAKLRALKNGPDGTLEKPFELLELLDQLDQHHLIPELLASDPLDSSPSDNLKFAAEVDLLKQELEKIREENQGLAQQRAVLEKKAQELAAKPAKVVEKIVERPVLDEKLLSERISAVESKHKKTLEALRSFYKEKLDKAQAVTSGSVPGDYAQERADLFATIESLKQELEKEKSLRQKISEALKGLQ